MPELDRHLEALRAVARSITHLGWGIDLVVGDASDELGDITGERWIAGRPGGTSLRRPISGTLEDLQRKHEQFLSRLEGATLRPVAPLAVFEKERYARSTDLIRRPFVVFQLLSPSADRKLALDPVRRSPDVAAWTRHAVGEASRRWPFGQTAALVHGHEDAVNSHNGKQARLSFCPLPTINARLRRVEGVGRVLITAPTDFHPHIDWLRSSLAGTDLTWNAETVAFLELLPSSDWVTQQYVATSHRWSTVTPVILPGHDDHSAEKAERLLCKAFLQAGFEPEVIASIERLEWRKVGFRHGLSHANRYVMPDKVVGPMFHVFVHFSKPVAGPLSIGSGRHRGLGLFAIA